MCLRKIALIGPCLASCSLAFGQEAVFEHFSVEHGLSQSQVTAVIQDSSGFMWFGTEDGLNKFDGYEFTIYKHDFADPTSISNNQIHTICETHHGHATTLWVGTDNGLNSFDNNKEQFIRYHHEPGNPNTLSSNTINAMIEDRFGILWIGTPNGLNRFDPVRKTITRWIEEPDHPLSLSHAVILSICEGYDTIQHTLWIGTQIGLNKITLSPGNDEIDYSRVSVTRYLNDPTNENSLTNNGVRAICQDHEGMLWIGTDGGGLDRMDVRTGMFSHFRFSGRERKNEQGWHMSVSDDKIFVLLEDREQSLWIGTFGGGLNRFDRHTKMFTHYRHDVAISTSISGSFVISSYEDRSNRLWIGTSGNGINKLERKKKKFQHLKPEPYNPNSLIDRSVLSIQEDRSGLVWIGTSNGLDRYDPATKQFTHYRHDPQNPYSITNNVVFAIRESRYLHDGSLWIGTRGGLNRLDPKTGRFIRYPNNPSDPGGLSHDFILTVHEEENGILWVGSGGGGLFRLEPDHLRGSKHFTNYKHDPANPKSLSNNHILVVYEDSRGDLWIGTSRGLNRFDVKTGEFKRYMAEPGNPCSISNNFIETIYEDTLISRNTLWVGTRKGLNRFDVETETFTRYTENDGLPNNVVVGILSDHQGSLWVSTFHGLARFNPATQAWRAYDLSDGLQSHEFTWGASHRGRSGRLYFGGVGGLNIFLPENVVDNTYVPPVIVTDFQVLNQSVTVGMLVEDIRSPLLEKSITRTEEIVIPDRLNQLSFEFAALDYTSPEKNSYAYMMEGFNDNWINLGNRRYVSFTNLAPGQYTLRVRGSNNDGVWNMEGTSVRLLITPPYWQTWWFRTIAMGVVISIPVLIYRYRAKQQIALERLRVKIASDLHDHIGASLNTIAIHAQLAKAGIGPEKSIENLSKIANLSRETVTALGDTVWSIDARNDRVKDLIDHMKDCADATLGDQNIEISYTISDLDDEKRIPVDLRQNLYLIFKEAVSNIAKYSGATKVLIEMVNHDGTFHMRITDNGKGLEGSTKRTGHGLRNMQMRAERIQAALTVSSHHGVTVLLKRAAI